MQQIRRDNYKSDEELLESLINLYAESIKKLLFTYVKDWTIADDLAQETFIACYKSLKYFREESSYKNWLYKIAINKYKDYVRSKWFKFGTIFEFFKEQELAGFKSVEESMIRKEDAMFLSQSVLSLPQIYREVIILYFYEDLSFYEIEEVTGVKQETLKTRLRRAKVKLRQNMGGDI